jgi:hypothetical protein
MAKSKNKDIKKKVRKCQVFGVYSCFVFFFVQLLYDKLCPLLIYCLIVYSIYVFYFIFIVVVVVVPPSGINPVKY